MNWGIRNRDTITHYGVKGMRWGVRRTPEQLGHARKARETTAGARPLNYKSPAAAKAWTVAKGTASYALAMLDPTGIYTTIYNAKTLKSYGDEIVAATKTNEKYQKKDGEPEKLANLKKKSTTGQSMSEDSSMVNKGSKDGRTKNCLACVCALEMRQRGYDVQARRKAYGASVEKYHEWFDGVEINNASISRQKGESRAIWVQKNYNYLTKSLEEYPSGSRGFLAFNYEGSKTGHTISWQVIDGSVSFYDAQSKKPTDADKVLSFSDQNYFYGRLDDCSVKQSINEMVVSRKEKR